jgi:hypothetical protein
MAKFNNRIMIIQSLEDCGRENSGGLTEILHVYVSSEKRINFICT